MRCEEFVMGYLPAVKATIVKKLYNEHGLNQVSISEILGITQPAVSQYLSGARGEFPLDDEIEKTVDDIADDIYELYNEGELTMRDVDELLCKVCKKI
ncbi:MAG: transcriptional regulator [Candidatus Saliniplasma sp.]